jgi:hypothetical protein
MNLLPLFNRKMEKNQVAQDMIIKELNKINIFDDIS